MKRVVSIFIFFFSVQMSFAQETSRSLLFADTVEISDPILIRFEENKNTDSFNVQVILVSRRVVDSLEIPENGSCRDFLLSKGYLFFTANRFSCLLNNFLHVSSELCDTTLYNQYARDLRGAEKDTVWVYFDKMRDKPKRYRGWEYHEIYPRRFLLFLVKGSSLYPCQTIDEIVIEDIDNIYIPVLVPITW